MTFLLLGSLAGVVSTVIAHRLAKRSKNETVRRVDARIMDGPGPFRPN